MIETQRDKSPDSDDLINDEDGYFPKISLRNRQQYGLTVSKSVDRGQ